MEDFDDFTNKVVSGIVNSHAYSFSDSIGQPSDPAGFKLASLE